MELERRIGTGRAVFGPHFARRLWRLTRLYWSSSDAWGGLLLALAVVLELATVYGNFLLADVQRRIYDALQEKQAAAFGEGVGIFVGFVIVFLLVSTYRIYVRQILEIRWRRWLTDHLLTEWIAPHACCQMELHGVQADNPDQRIAEDIRNFVASALGLSLSLLSALATLASFAGLLWSLSGDWSIAIVGTELRIPGLMMWVAVVYASLATWITHRVGRHLIPINFDRLRYEADFRFTLVRFRESAAAVAFAGGEARERERARDRFGWIVANWWQLIRAQRNLALLTTGIGQVNGAVPLLVAAPGYFLGRLTLGRVAQTGIAYAQVSGALAWFVNAYQEIAQWRASIERLLTLIDAMESTHTQLARAGVRVEPNPSPGLRLSDLRLELPSGRVLLDHANASISPGERVVVAGPSGAGQSTLFRAIAGHWPFGGGRIEVPARARTLFLSQRPYLPIGTLREAVSYPAPAGAFADEEIRGALRLLGLGPLEGRLDEIGHWEKQLSESEQQRLAFARVLLHEPDWVFLDDATGALDEAMERSAYESLTQRLPHTTVVSITHRPAVAQYHTRRWTLVPGGDGGASLQAA
jgi:vitamin B12/bleomycin/antimicrobial peptide transport system ATP-binding/permease protein